MQTKCDKNVKNGIGKIKREFLKCFMIGEKIILEKLKPREKGIMKNIMKKYLKEEKNGVKIVIMIMRGIRKNVANASDIRNQ